MRMGQAVSIALLGISTIPALSIIIEDIKKCMGLNESVEDLETQVNQLEKQLSDLQRDLTILEQGSKRRKQEVVSWIEQATKLTKDFPPLKERAIQGQWWEKYSSIDRVKKMSEAVEDVKNDLRNIGELVVEGSTIPSLVDKNMNALKGQVTQLSSQAKDIETTLMNLERGGKKKRKLEVKDWLEQVEEMKNKFATFNIESITSLEDVQTMREDVKKLRDEGKKFRELTVDVDESTIPSLDVSQLSGKSSNDNLEKLYGWLEDDKVLSIGVYGMGGVGKTTLAKHIYNHILQKMSHVNVYWVTVSQDFTIKKLQDEIAKIARVEFLDKIEEQRPAILNQHLVRNNVVLILDDVWDNIPLEKLGVKGCKLILTTRLRDVCRRIGCQKLFQVNVLNEEEGWNLFKEILIQNGHTVLTDDIEKHAKELAKKCGGLPLALNTVAASMRGANDDHTWRNAIKNFQNASLQLEDLEKNVFETLEFSYNRLNDERWKKCFLYCCLYSEDEEIIKDEVIMKLIAEGLCEDRDEGHSILNKLVDVFLLEGAEWYVKMHDLMREMALKISKFMVKSELTEIPEEKHWITELERVSFMDTSIKEIPNGFSLKCQKLSTLILVRNWWLKSIPETFLSNMTQLRVLDLSGNTNLKCLPNSISDLKNLCGLFLQCCERISCLPKMKKLKALRVLNIRGCFGIRELPQDMKYLVSLQYLYMRGTSKYLKIPEGVIAELTNLRCLHLDYSGSGLQSEELNRLRHLQGFKNKYYDLRNFNNTTLVKKLEKLEWYDICVGMWDRIKLDVNKRNVYFEGLSFIGERGQVLLPANICGLKIVDCEGLNGCLADNFQSMRNLKELQVRRCKEVEWIFNSTPFKSLESLDLARLPNLVSVCKGEDAILPANCNFSFLKHLSIQECDSMKKLSQALLQNLKNLETLTVAYCQQLEEIIGGIEGSSNTLPKLKLLRLEFLAELKSICNGREMICPSIERIIISHCKNIKRMPSFFPIDDATRQPYLSSSFERIDLNGDEKEWWESLEFHNPNAKHFLEAHIKWYR